MSQRIVISAFSAAEIAGGAKSQLAPGETLSNCRIHRHTQAEVDGGAEPYMARFERAGEEYHAALPIFQARTQPVEAAGEATGEAGALAV